MVPNPFALNLMSNVYGEDHCDSPQKRYFPLSYKMCILLLETNTLHDFFTFRKVTSSFHFQDISTSALFKNLTEGKKKSKRCALHDLDV